MNKNNTRSTKYVAMGIALVAYGFRSSAAGMLRIPITKGTPVRLQPKGISSNPKRGKYKPREHQTNKAGGKRR